MKDATKRIIFGTFLLAVLGYGTSAGALDLPCRTVKFIVPIGPGGITDIQTRMIADAANKLGAKPKLQAINIKGQGGVEAGRVLRDAEPDGCTIMYAHWNPMLLYLTGRIEVNYDAYEPIALMTSAYRMIGASKDAPYNNLAEMVAYAKEHGPDSVIAGATLGATSHFQLLMLEDEGNIKFKTVSYNGSRERITALLANNIQVSDIGTITAAKYIQQGKMKGLGVLGPRRSPMVPDVPTSKENGLTTEFSLSHGVFAPKGTPREIIAYYEGIFEEVAKDETFRKAMATKDVNVTFMPSGEYKTYLAENFAKFKRLATAIGIYKGK